MKHSIHRLSAALLLLLSYSLAPAAAAQRLDVFEVLEGAAEVSELTLKSSSSQTVYARRCDECPTLALSVGPETQYFNGGRAITLSGVAGQTRNATVFFNSQSRRVTRILFWQ